MRPGLRRLLGVLRAVIPVLLLAVLLRRIGAEPFRRSLHVLTPWPVAAALILGGVTVLAQAMRWRMVASAFGPAPELTRRRAVREYYRSALLNSVLPGGVLGDAVRAWRQRPEEQGRLRQQALAAAPQARAVLVERVMGTAVLMLAAAVAALRWTGWITALMLAGAVLAGAIAWPAVTRLPGAARLAVLGWSVLALASVLALFAVAAARLGTVHRSADVIPLALIVLAGMSVPVGLGGFGPREAVAALAFTAFGLSAEAGVATSVGYGVLAAVSTVPGALVMLLDAGGLHRGTATRGRNRGQVGGAR
jgi:glycosyltransferase 2 family protein